MRSDQLTPKRLLLIDAILTLPETSFENESQYRIIAINAITMYCGVEEGSTPRRISRGRPVKNDTPPVTRAEEPNALSTVIRNIKGKKRPTKCFICLGNPSLALRESVASYATLGSLSRHFLRKHASKLYEGAYLNCQICNIRLRNRLELLIHIEKSH